MMAAGEIETDRQIARRAGVEHHIVGRLRAKLDKEHATGVKPQLQASSERSATPTKPEERARAAGEIQGHGGDRGNQHVPRSRGDTLAPSLSDLGFSRSRASRYGILRRLP
jgi:hypothetical protein